MPPETDRFLSKIYLNKKTTFSKVEFEPMTIVVQRNAHAVKAAPFKTFTNFLVRMC